jgi:probable rRNA maturation factor
MIDVELVGLSAARKQRADLPSAARARALCRAAAASAGVRAGHLAVEFVDATKIAALNFEHRGKPEPTDVLSFPVDGAAGGQPPIELGDVVICVAHTSDVEEAIVHGVLHLAGMDHETDHGEMLARQREVLTDAGPARLPAARSRR